MVQENEYTHYVITQKGHVLGEGDRSFLFDKLETAEEWFSNLPFEFKETSKIVAVKVVEL